MKDRFFKNNKVGQKFKVFFYYVVERSLWFIQDGFKREGKYIFRNIESKRIYYLYFFRKNYLMMYCSEEIEFREK